MIKTTPRRKLYKIFSGEATYEQERDILRWLDMDMANMDSFMSCRKAFDQELLCDRDVEICGSRRRVSVLRYAKGLGRIAAFIALAVFVGYWMSSRTVDRLSSLTNTVVVPAGQRVNVTLPDGTNVWLNSLSELSYPAVFTGDGRNVKLSGEGFFDVAHDKNNPFKIHTDRYDVKVLGTKFNISSSPEADDFSVSVVEGSVQVNGYGNSAESLVLAMNQQAFEKEGRLVKQASFDSDVLLWREGVLSFTSARLEDLFERFEQSYGIKVVSHSSTLPTALFSGKFRTSDGIFHALNILQREVRFTYRWDEEHNIIYIN